MDINKNSMKKLTMGRRKIEIKRIEKKSTLQVTFTKRRNGLFKKASELGILSGSEIAILVQSPANKMFKFGNPNVESVIRRFQSDLTFCSDQLYAGNYNTSAQNQIVGGDDCEVKIKYEDAVRRLKVEKEMEKRNKGMKGMKESKFWWKEPFESMELQELEAYLEGLEVLKNSVLYRMAEIERVTMADEFPIHLVEGCIEDIWWR